MREVTFDELRKDGKRISWRDLISLEGRIAGPVLKHSNGECTGVNLILSDCLEDGPKSKVVVFIPRGLPTEDLRYFDRFEQGTEVRVEGYYKPNGHFLGVIDATFYKVK